MDHETQDTLQDIARENTEGSRQVREDDEDHDEKEPEPSEEDLALKSLDREHVEDYLAIKHAVEHTDLAVRLVQLAVSSGLYERGPAKEDTEPAPF